MKWVFAISAIAIVLGGLAVTLPGNGALSDTSPTPTPGEKQRLIERFEEKLSHADQSGPPQFAPMADDPSDIHSTPKPWPTGILSLDQPPFPGNDLRFQNMWRGAIENGYITALAGSYKSRPEQGIVMVVVSISGGQTISEGSGYYKPAAPTGALRIEAADGMLLTLSAGDGSTFLFDVASRQFLSPDTLIPLPTLTPAPTPVPTLPPGTVQTVAVDANVLILPSNTATSVGTREATNCLVAGHTVDIDVTVAGIPPASGSSGGMTAFEFKLLYDPAFVEAVSANVGMLLAAHEGSSVGSVGDTMPDRDGTLHVAAYDSSTTPESGEGVLARIRLKGLATGVSVLTLTDVGIQDFGNTSYNIAGTLDGSIAVSPVCP